MFEAMLEELGLSVNEARVYEALLNLGAASIEQVSIKSGAHRRNVYDVLAKLLEKGLISESFVQNRKEYRAMRPTRLLDLLGEKEKRLEAVLPEMEKRFAGVQEQEAAFMYRGINGFKNYLQDILTTNETVYFIGAKAFWLDPRLRHFLPKFMRERKRLGIKFMHLFDYDVKEQKPEILKLVGKPYRFLPKQYTSPTAVDVFGDYVVTFVGVKPGELAEDPVQFVIKSRRLADGYRKYFQYMWDKSKEE